MPIDLFTKEDKFKSPTFATKQWSVIVGESHSLWEEVVRLMISVLDLSFCFGQVIWFIYCAALCNRIICSIPLFRINVVLLYNSQKWYNSFRSSSSFDVNVLHIALVSTDSN